MKSSLTIVEQRFVTKSFNIKVLYIKLETLILFIIKFKQDGLDYYIFSIWHFSCHSSENWKCLNEIFQ